MSSFGWGLVAVGVLAVFLLYRWWSRQRREAFVTELSDALRALGMVVASEYEWADFEGMEGAHLLFHRDDEVIHIEALRLFEIMENPDLEHRRKQLSLMWLKAEQAARQQGEEAKPGESP